MLGPNLIKEILQNGGSVDIPSIMLGQSPPELARAAKSGGSHITFRNPAWPIDMLKAVAKAGAGHVTFRFDG